jgi:hypothetical protein
MDHAIIGVAAEPHTPQMLGDPSVEGIVQEQIGQQRAHYTPNNVANIRLKWGLRVARGCLAPGFAGTVDVGITLVIEIATAMEPQP